MCSAIFQRHQGGSLRGWRHRVQAEIRNAGKTSRTRGTLPVPERLPLRVAPGETVPGAHGLVLFLLSEKPASKVHRGGSPHRGSSSLPSQDASASTRPVLASRPVRSLCILRSRGSASAWGAGTDSPASRQSSLIPNFSGGQQCCGQGERNCHSRATCSSLAP